MRDSTSRVGLPTRRRSDYPPSPKAVKWYSEGLVLSNEGDCAAASECWLPMSKRDAKTKWLAEHELFISSNGRVYAKFGVTYMDAITGTLYRGEHCLSSDTLTTGELVQNQVEATKTLLAIKGVSNYD